jgi:hypothetical protein
MANQYRGKVNVLHKTNKRNYGEGWRFSKCELHKKKEDGYWKIKARRIV